AVTGQELQGDVLTVGPAGLPDIAPTAAAQVVHEAVAGKRLLIGGEVRRFAHGGLPSRRRDKGTRSQGEGAHIDRPPVSWSRRLPVWWFLVCSTVDPLAAKVKERPKCCGGAAAAWLP